MDLKEIRKKYQGKYFIKKFWPCSYKIIRISDEYLNDYGVYTVICEFIDTNWNSYNPKKRCFVVLKWFDNLERIPKNTFNKKRELTIKHIRN